MVSIEEQCSSCGKMGNVSYVQGFVSQIGELRGHKEFHCSRCNARYYAHIDGWLIPTMRQRLLEQDGYWELILVDERSRVPAIKIIRQALGLTLLELREITGSSGTRMYVGTQAETQWLQHLMLKDEITTTIRKKV
jgi:hypothetical protein